MGYGMTADRIAGYLEETRHQPGWRQEADIDADYYDGHQLTSAQVAEIEEAGLAPSIVNLIKPTIDLILGMEAKTRREVIVRPELANKENEDVADALNVELKEALRMTRAHRAVSDAYKGQVGLGIGWVYVGRGWDPFGYPYVVEHVDRREMWWDWRDTQPDLSNLRYLVRRKWYDEDFVEAVFPQYSKIRQLSPNLTATWDFADFAAGPEHVRSLDVPRDYSLSEQEWLDTSRRRVCLYEIWYKTFQRGYVFRTPAGRVVELDRSNPRHLQYLVETQTVPTQAVIPKIRLSWWIGPNRVADVPNPYPHNRFPYVPFFGFREDRTGAPYGYIRTMRYGQDEINARMRKMLWLLSAKRVIADSDALENRDKDTVMGEVARPDAYIELNPRRLNKGADAFRVESDFGLNNQQFQVLGWMRDMVQATAGVYTEQLGRGQTGQSGVAIAELVEQGTTSLAEVNDNYAHSRTLVGELLLNLVRQDLAKRNDYEVTVGDAKHKRRKILLNASDQDNVRRNNDVMLARVQVALGDMPHSLTLKQQQFQQMGELIKSLPEPMQVATAHLVVEASDVPNKDEWVDALRKAAGLEDEPDLREMSDEERQEYFAEKQRQMQLQQRVQDAQLADLESTVRERLAKIEKLLADADLTRAKTEETTVKTEIAEDQNDRSEEQHARNMTDEPEAAQY